MTVPKFTISQGQSVSNDGGQIESTLLQNINDIQDPANKRGEWLQNAFGNNTNSLFRTLSNLIIQIKLIFSEDDCYLLNQIK